MEKRIKIIEWGITIFVAIVFFVFFVTKVWGNIFIAGTSELFLLTPEFVLNYLAYPSGAIELLSKFFLQFFALPYGGAIVLSVFFILLQRLVWRAACMFKVNHAYYLLSFVILDLFFFENVIFYEKPMIGMSCILSFSFFIFVSRIKKSSLRYFGEVFSIVLLYWLVGGMHFVFLFLVLFFETIINVRKRMFYEAFFLIVFYLVLAFLLPALVAYASVWQFFEVASFVNVHLSSNESFYIFLAAILPVIVAFAPSVRGVKGYFVTGAQVVLLFTYMYLGLTSYSVEEELFHRDVYYASTNQWDCILENSKTNKPQVLSRNVLRNLALQRTGRMADDFFIEQPLNFSLFLYPHDVQQRTSFTCCITTGIVSYEVGLLNQSLEYFSEFNAAQSSDNLNVLVLKYQIKLLIARGDYKAADKLLKIMKKTLFHRAWAEEMSTYVYDDGKVMGNKDFARFREIVFPENLVYSAVDWDVVLFSLYKANPHNRIIYEYLLHEILRHRDLKDFAVVYDIGKQYIEYPRGIPQNFQQALALYWAKSGFDPNEIPYYIEPKILNDCFSIVEASKFKNVASMVRDAYPNTFLSYYFEK